MIKAEWTNKDALDLQPTTCNQLATELISRQDAVNEIHKYFVEEIYKTPTEIDEDGDELYADMPMVNSLLACNKELSKRIKSLPSAEPKTGWIPVSERLPEKDGWYLVTIRGYETVTDVSLYHADGSEWGDVSAKQKVIAWMPLPEPYDCETKMGGTKYGDHSHHPQKNIYSDDWRKLPW